MSQTKKEKPSTEIIFGIFMILVSIYFYKSLRDLELSGGEMKVPVILYFLYEKFGKDVTAGVLFLGGLVFLVNGILKRNNEKKHKEIEKKNSKPKFILINEEEFQVKRKLTHIEAEYLNNLDLEIKEGKVYKHFWIDNIAKNENDQSWLNIAKYFWNANEPFYNTSLPEVFNNYKQLNFRFLKNQSIIKTEILTEAIQRYYCEAVDQIIFIPELVEQNLIEYCHIEDIDEDTIGDLKYFKEDLFLLITNPKIKLQNNELYIGTEIISFEIAYTIGAFELMKRENNEIWNDFVGETLPVY